MSLLGQGKINVNLETYNPEDFFKYRSLHILSPPNFLHIENIIREEKLHQSSLVPLDLPRSPENRDSKGSRGQIPHSFYCMKIGRIACKQHMKLLIRVKVLRA